MLRNLSGGGFLAEASASVPVGSIHTIKLTAHGGLTAIVTARCAHCRQLVPFVVPRFAIGFEFLTAQPDEIAAMLDQLMPDVAFP